MDTTFSIRIDTELLKRIDAALPLSEARSRNDYIKKAIQFYNVYLQLNGEVELFSGIVGSTVEAKINEAVFKTEAQHKEAVERLARNQFKIAIELAKLALIIGDNLNIPSERMADWHVQATDEVRSTDGILGFQDRLE